MRISLFSAAFGTNRQTRQTYGHRLPNRTRESSIVSLSNDHRGKGNVVVDRVVNTEASEATINKKKMTSGYMTKAATSMAASYC